MGARCRGARTEERRGSVPGIHVQAFRAFQQHFCQDPGNPGMSVKGVASSLLAVHRNMCKAHERVAKRRVGEGMGGGCPPSHSVIFFEDLLEMARFGGTLIIIYRCKSVVFQTTE